MGERTRISKIHKGDKKIIDVHDKIEKAFDLQWRRNPNFNDTPFRIAKSFLTERCIGINSRLKCRDILNSVTFPVKYHGFIVIDPIYAYGLCPHHFENITYKVQIGYIPQNNQVVGLSKLARVVKLFASQPLMQEEFTSKLSEIFMDVIDPEAFGLIITGEHNCMVARGVKTHGAKTITSIVEGSALDNPSVKAEFLELVKNDK